MIKKINLDEKKVLKIYCSILKKCPQCKGILIPLGDGMIEPYHYCFSCKISIPMMV